MFVERIVISNFRCFGPEESAVDLSSRITTFIGLNGAGKTAAIQALLRMFGITADQRRVKRQDFHVPNGETRTPQERRLFIEAILAFPELAEAGADRTAIPEFFQQLATDQNGTPKCRLRLEATWVDDSTLEGAIETKLLAMRSFNDADGLEPFEVRAAERSRIQMIYVPATRDGASQVTAFLRSRLWRAIEWSDGMKASVQTSGDSLSQSFAQEQAVALVSNAVKSRWQEVHSAGTDTIPVFRPLDFRFEEFIRKVEVVFHPDEAGRSRGVDELSDGQRSLFHLAMTAAALDVEGRIAATPPPPGFDPDGITIPALTLIAVEEPENNLAPFYLSRIISQIRSLTTGPRAQALISSHSPSILTRIDPLDVRYFRLSHDRVAQVRGIRLPENDEAASKFVREAVTSYPELYFARFVVLGEGASEEVVLPKLAEAMGLAIDRTFVAVVPLGGRHVNHLWKLLVDLDIPHATLLDLDHGRSGGGWARIKTVCRQLVANGVSTGQLFPAAPDPLHLEANLAGLDAFTPGDLAPLTSWVQFLRNFNVFFSFPLDLDFSMLRDLFPFYTIPEEGRAGPSPRGEPREAVLGEEGNPAFYGPEADALLRWYRYLFLGRGKPSTHMRVLSLIPSTHFAATAPEELRALLLHIVARLFPAPPQAR